MKLKEYLKIVSLPAILASLCCLSPLILLFLGLSTVSFASSLADTFYGDYKWAFRLLGLVTLAISTVLYLRRQKGICTLDAAKKRRQEIINISISVLVVGTLAYMFLLYVVVHYAGVFAGVWEDYF